MSSDGRAFLRSLIAPLTAAVVTLALLTALWALRPQPSEGTAGVNDPVPGQVFQVSVDTDTIGNPTGSELGLAALAVALTVLGVASVSWHRYRRRAP